MTTHAEIERKIFPIIRRGLRQQIAPVEDAIRERGPEYAGSQLNRLITVDPIYSAFNDFYPSLLVRVARSQYNELEATKAIIPQWILDAWNQFAATYLITDIFSRMLSITDTSRRRVSRLIQREVEAEEILRMIGARDFVDPHAYTIARTEATTILNVGSERGAMGYGDANTVNMWHRWVPQEDFVTRPAHFAMRDARPIPLGMSFEVGGEMLLYPGDPSGSARNTINCRCVQRFFTEAEVAKRHGTDYVNSFNSILV